MVIKYHLAPIFRALWGSPCAYRWTIKIARDLACRNLEQQTHECCLNVMLMANQYGPLYFSLCLFCFLFVSLWFKYLFVVIVLFTYLQRVEAELLLYDDDWCSLRLYY